MQEGSESHEAIQGGNVAFDEFPTFEEDEHAVNMRLNSSRLETYLRGIKQKLLQHDKNFQDHADHVDRISRADDTKIARLAVRLDHCLLDINNFKDAVLARSSSGTADLSKFGITDLKAEVSSLSTLVRRVELSQAEGLDSFAQIKQLNATLKSVTRQLDSLGKNSVILELRTHVEQLVRTLRDEQVSVRSQQEREGEELRERLRLLADEGLASLEQRLAAIEEKAAVYDMVLSEQGGFGDGDGDGEEGDAAIGAQENGEAGLLPGGFDEGAGESVRAIDLGAGEEPLRPSQMLLLDQPGSGKGDTPDDLSPGGQGSWSAEGEEQMDDAGELRAVPRRSAFNAADAFFADGSSRSTRLTSSVSRSSFVARGGPSASMRSVAEGSFALVSKKGVRGRQSSMKRSSFFSNLMGQYVGRAEFAETVQELAQFARSTTDRLKHQLRQHGANSLFATVLHMHADVLRHKRRRAFRLLQDNVQAWHAVRNRRNRAKALMFQARLERLCGRQIKTVGFRHWARMTRLFKERERLRLWLRNMLRHWIDMKVINVRIYLSRWKRFTVHSYHSSLTTGDQSDLDASGISDDFRRLLESENFSLREVKRIAKDDMRRRWALRERQERLLAQQESAIREQVQKVTIAMTKEGFPALGGPAMKSEEVQAMARKIAEMEDGLRQVRLEMRRVFNNMETAASETDAKIEAESRRAAAEFNVYRSQVAVRFNDAKEGLTLLQNEMRAQFDAEQRRLVHLEDRLKMIDRRLDGEQSKIAPLVAEQQRMESLVDSLKGEMRVTDTQVDALHGKIDRAAAASLSTVDSNKRLERVLGENAEYYDVELRFMRTHVEETVRSLQDMHSERRAFVSQVEATIQGMMTDLNSFVERLPSGAELFEMCREYEELWVRLHHEGAVKEIPDALHSKVAQVSLRIAHHIAASADRLVLARWTAASTGRKAVSNPQEAPSAFVRGSTTTSARAKAHVLSELVPETTTLDAAAATTANREAGGLDEGMQVEATWDVPSADLVEQVRDELLEKYLATGFVTLLRAADEKNGPPGMLKATGRATFQRKLKRAIEAALTKHSVMVDPLQTSGGAALSLARVSRKHQLGAKSTASQRLDAECDACVSCGQGLANIAAIQGAPSRTAELSGVPVARPLSGQQRAATASFIRTYTYPANLVSSTKAGRWDATSETAAALLDEELREDDQRHDDAYEHLPETDRAESAPWEQPTASYRPDSPLSQISVTMTKKLTAAAAWEARPLPDSAVLEQEAAPARTKARPLSASASASTRHREALKHSHSNTLGAVDMGSSSASRAPQAVNMRTVGRETALILQPQATLTGGPAFSVAEQQQFQRTVAGARVGAGFEVPIPVPVQSSSQLAAQLASRFKQDATFHGTDTRKVDPGEALQSLQTSRKLVGLHGTH